MTGVVGLVGTGLIGASIGLAARGLGWHVAGCDVDATALRDAHDLRAIDEIASRSEVYDGADVVVIAAPVDATLAEIERVRQERPIRPRLLIDVASVKLPVARAVADIANFVPTHPMTGSERIGPRAARADLFENCTWAYVSSGDPEVVRRAVEFAGALGALPVPVDAAEHDRTVALTSHLPQLLSTLFSARLRGRSNTNVDALCGPAARELLRLGRSDFAVWQSIFVNNGPNVVGEARAMAADLRLAAEVLEGGCVDDLAALFTRARDGM